MDHNPPLWAFSSVTPGGSTGKDDFRLSEIGSDLGRRDRTPLEEYQEFINLVQTREGSLVQNQQELDGFLD